MPGQVAQLAAILTLLCVVEDGERLDIAAPLHRHARTLTDPGSLASGKAAMGDLSFIWLELTGKCQLRCAHCYAESGPSGTHGAMSAGDWLRVIDQAAGLGVKAVQFIGGEPTVHPDLATLVLHALARALHVEVFSNLVHVRPDLWKLFSVPGVSLATSYYSDDPAQHEAITGRRGSHAKTRANIVETIRRGIPLRVAVIDLGHNQRWRQAVAELEELGVTAIGCDRLRQVGRGVRDTRPDLDQLCGRCINGVAAISPRGEVWPCVFARWMPSGNVLEHSLAEVLDGGLRESRRRLMAWFNGHHPTEAGDLRRGPNCEPIDCGPRCGPMVPSCGPEECSPLRQFCSPNYPGPDRRCQPRERPCRPMQCNPTRP